MKRILLILFTIPLFLVACGSDELESFTKDFNKNAKTHGLEELSTDEFGKIVEIKEELEEGIEFGEIVELEEIGENMSSQILYESDEYVIQAKYKDGKNVSGYLLVIETDGSYAELKGKGFDAGINIAEVLDLDVKKLKDIFKEENSSLETEDYMDRGYKITYFYPDASLMFINFDEQ